MNLPTDQYLRFRLSRLHVGATMEWDGWFITRERMRFTLQPPDSERRINAPPKGTTISCDFLLQRAISYTVAAILTPSAAPELIFRNIVRCGSRYQVWHYDDGRWTPVLYADSAQQADDEYRAWKSASRALSRAQIKAAL